MSSYAEVMDFDALSGLPAAQLRQVVPSFLGGYFSVQDPGLVEETVAGAAAVLHEASDAELKRAMSVYGAAGQHWRVHEADPVLRALARDWMPRCMPQARVVGLERLPDDGRGCLWIGNHLSYVDTQVADSLVARAKIPCADEVLVVAGPKAFTEPFRRVAATALNTLMTPQSGRLEHNEHGLSQRQIAALAVDCMESARTWMTERGPLLLYPEGSRSRTGHLGSFLRATARYSRAARLVVPVAVTGTEKLFAFDHRMRVAEVTLTIGEPFVPGAGKTAALEQAWAALSELLPAPYKPLPGTPVLR